VCVCVCVFVNNFLAQVQVQLSPNFVRHTLATEDEVIKFWKVKVGWGGMRSAARPSSMSFDFTVG